MHGDFPPRLKAHAQTLGYQLLPSSIINSREYRASW